MTCRERFFGLTDLESSQEANLQRELFDGRPERRARVQHLGVSIASDDLRRRDRYETETRAHVLLDRRIDVGERADRTGEFPDRDRGSRVLGPFHVALDLQREERELRAERRGFGVLAVRSPGDRHID